MVLPLPNMRQLVLPEFHLADFSGVGVFGQHHVKLAGIGELDEPNIKIRLSLVEEHIAYSVPIVLQPIFCNESTLFEIPACGLTAFRSGSQSVCI